jgi:hypothetical protein
MCAGSLNRTEKRENPRANRGQPPELANRHSATTPSVPRIPAWRPACPRVRASASRREPSTARHMAGVGGFSRGRAHHCVAMSRGCAQPQAATWCRLRLPAQLAYGRRAADVSIGHYFPHLISFPSELPCRKIIYPFRSSRRARRNGAV